MAQEKTVELRIIQTSDVHGCFFPYDYINMTPAKGSMARVYSYVKKLRTIYGKNLLLLDNGDILQGQPTCYYCNYIKPESKNVAASIVNYMGYDAQTIGNHDIETGKFYENPALIKALSHAEKNNSSLHVMGLFSNGGVT